MCNDAGAQGADQGPDVATTPTGRSVDRTGSRAGPAGGFGNTAAAAGKSPSEIAAGDGRYGDSFLSALKENPILAVIPGGVVAAGAKVAANAAGIYGEAGTQTAGRNDGGGNDAAGGTITRAGAQAAQASTAGSSNQSQSINVSGRVPTQQRGTLGFLGSARPTLLRRTLG
jgi:hypothetical protein